MERRRQSDNHEAKAHCGLPQHGSHYGERLFRHDPDAATIRGLLLRLTTTFRFVNLVRCTVKALLLGLCFAADAILVMRVASLFSGIGGLDWGLHKSGHNIVLQCESDLGAQQVCAIRCPIRGKKVLKTQFPGVLLVPDICALQSLPGGVDLVAAGFPCTDVSRAGLRKGLQGKSTCLVQHVFRLLKAALDDFRGVPWVLLENVEGLLDRIPEGPPAIEYVVGQLEGMGYSWAYRIVNTAGFGLPHRRKRVILVASLSGDPRDVLLTQGAGYCHGACRHIFNGSSCYLCHQNEDAEEESVQHTYAVDLGNAQSGPAVDVIPTMKTQNERICLFLDDGRAGYLRIEDAERLQGLPEGWTRACYPIASPISALLSAATLQDSHLAKCESYRWGLLGNAVSVPVAQWIGEALSKPYTHKYVSGPSDTPMPSHDTGEGRSERTAASLLFTFRGNQDNSTLASLLDLQFAALDKAPTHSSEEAQQSRNRDSWPRAAWGLQGMGRHAVEDMSEAPVLTPLRTLGSFISELGQMPTPSSISTYLARLAERGFNTYSLIKKVVSCGLRLSTEVTAVVRLKEGLQDLETLGQLAWCQTPERIWWPCEVLDPWHMPPARQLPQNAAAALSPAKRKLSLPCTAAEAPAPLILESADSQSPGGASVSPQAATEVVSQPAPSRIRAIFGGREVFVVLYGSRKAMWAPPKQLLPFKRHLLEKQSEGQALIDAKKMQHPRLFKTGVRQALAMSELLSRASNGGEHAEAVAALAAAQACEENLQVRCRECEACLANTGAMRRCLLMRVCAAAAAGHSGAQVAVLGEGAVGARISVWWRLDEKYYDGLVESFDKIRQRHTVFYDDGDIELIPLWAPNQMVKVITDPKDWQASALALQIKRDEYMRAAAAQRRLRKRAVAEASSAIPVAGVLTQYEQRRADNIARNSRVLAAMRLTSTQPGRK